MTEYVGMLVEFRPISMEYVFKTVEGSIVMYGESTVLMNALFDAMKYRQKIKIVIDDKVRE